MIEIILVLVVVLTYLIFRCSHKKSRDKFVSNQARIINAQAHEVFTDGGDVKYTKYRASVPDTDPVQYSDVRRLWREGKLTPENVQETL